MKAGYYSIPLSGLKEGSHVYDFVVEREFFENFEETEIRRGVLNVEARLIKRSAHMELTISLKGEVLVACDRCLDEYWQEIESGNRMLIKYGESWDEADDEVVTIAVGESSFDLSQLIYEFAHLALPLQRFHPDNEDGESTCNPDMIEKLGEHVSDSEEIIDPRWKDLGSLKRGLKN